MKISDKNRAKFRREVEEGDKITYTGVGMKTDHHFQGTVTFPGTRQVDGYLLVMPGGISGKAVVLDYYRITEWHRNGGDRG